MLEVGTDTLYRHRHPKERIESHSKLHDEGKRLKMYQIDICLQKNDILAESINCQKKETGHELLDNNGMRII